MMGWRTAMKSVLACCVAVSCSSSGDLARDDPRTPESPLEATAATAAATTEATPATSPPSHAAATTTTTTAATTTTTLVVEFDRWPTVADQIRRNDPDFGDASDDEILKDVVAFCKVTRSESAAQELTDDLVVAFENNGSSFAQLVTYISSMQIGVADVCPTNLVWVNAAVASMLPTGWVESARQIRETSPSLSGRTDRELAEIIDGLCIYVPPLSTLTYDALESDMRTSNATEGVARGLDHLCPELVESFRAAAAVPLDERYRTAVGAALFDAGIASSPAVDVEVATGQALCADVPNSPASGGFEADWNTWRARVGEVLDPGDGVNSLSVRLPIAARYLCPERADDFAALVAGAIVYFDDGAYEVGEDIEPGSWITTGDIRDCFWERSRRDGSTVDVDFVTAAREIIVEVEADELFTTSGCPPWTRIR